MLVNGLNVGRVLTLIALHVLIPRIFMLILLIVPVEQFLIQISDWILFSMLTFMIAFGS